MSSDRLREVEEILARYRKLVSGKEKALTASPPSDWALIELQIADVKEKMQPFKEEYWQILADESATTAISEPTAEVIVAEIVERVEQLQISQEYSDEVLEWLEKIYAKVSKPGTPAAAKLKGALSLLPPFVSLSYEAELDTENFLQAHFPTFRKWSKALAKKL